MHVMIFWVEFEGGRLAVARKAERVVDIRIWVKICIEMDRVYGEADLCAVRNMEPVPQVDAFRCGDLERIGQMSRPSWAWSQWRRSNTPDAGVLSVQSMTAAYFLF